MHQKVLFLIGLCCLAFVGSSHAQNVGIGTTTPGSKLTVAGSFGGGYTAVPSNTYSILDNDYYIVWSGSGAGTFTLPASSLPAKGRIYKIKNNTSSHQLTIQAAGAALIDGTASVRVAPGSGVEIIANGNTTGTCWEVVGMLYTTAATANAGASAGVLGGAGGFCNPSPEVSSSLVAG